nr:unnamed protein product [Callosobruchus analis]
MNLKHSENAKVCSVRSGRCNECKLRKAADRNQYQDWGQWAGLYFKGWQIYVKEICRAIITGCCSNSLARRDPGRQSHSRWLTTAGRLLRLYIRTVFPPENFKILAEYTVEVYTPVLFKVNVNFIDPLIQTNGYFAHPEKILLTILCDARKYIRELALRRILKARENPARTIRQFQTPKLNFVAKDYIDLISRQNCNLTELPLTFGYSTDELKDMVNSGCVNEDGTVMDFQKLPCHMQAVKRCVKLEFLVRFPEIDSFAPGWSHEKLCLNLMSKHNVQLNSKFSEGWYLLTMLKTWRAKFRKDQGAALKNTTGRKRPAGHVSEFLCQITK